MPKGKKPGKTVVEGDRLDGPELPSFPLTRSEVEGVRHEVLDALAKLSTIELSMAQMGAPFYWVEAVMKAREPLHRVLEEASMMLKREGAPRGGGFLGALPPPRATEER